jgi:REP element-mobilizing transposase RayT
LVLITENRAPLFSDRYFQPFSEIFSRVARSFSKTDIELIWLASDHLHLFLDTSPDYPVDEIVHIGIKKSEFEILNRFPEFQQKTETVWKRDYFVETVG